MAHYTNCSDHMPHSQVSKKHKQTNMADDRMTPKQARTECWNVAGKPATSPLVCIRAVSLVTCSYRMTKLHFSMSSPSSATVVAMMILYWPLWKYFRMSSCWDVVIPKRGKIRLGETALCLHFVGTTRVAQFCTQSRHVFLCGFKYSFPI